MKILVSGCSLSSGWGFANERLDVEIWPNIVANALGAECVNLAETGSDNCGIFLNTVDYLSGDWDLILVQITALDRVVLRAVPETDKLITSENMLPGWISQKKWQEFYDVFSLINGRMLHWFRFCKMIRFLQKDPRLYLINGLMDWDQEFWNDRGVFIESMFDPWEPTEDQCQTLVPLIQKQRHTIDPNRWINLYNSWYQHRVDQVSQDDPHPGVLSHKIYANQVLEFLDQRL